MLYTILKGWHFALPPFPIIFWRKNVYEWTVLFNNSCAYDIEVDQEDINKLCGISFGGVHNNSARFGWRYNKHENKIELLAYCYENGIRLNTIDNEKSLGFLELNKQYDIRLIVGLRAYFFCIKGYPEVLQLKENKNGRLGFYSRPFFGGNKPAPHSITIKLKTL